MRLRSLGRRSRYLPSKLGLQGAPKEPHRPDPLDAPQAGLDVEQGGGQPSLLLVGGAPAIDSGRPLSDQGVQGFEAVRRLQTDAELREDAEAMEGERLLQPLVE